METKLTTAEETKTKKGPAPVLDAEKRRLILALISNGFSRRMAARYVRCAPTTITNTAERDAQFADELAAADNSVALESLAAVRRAAKQDRYWRAAAWLLERQSPEEFAQPRQDVMPQSLAFEFLQALLKGTLQNLPEEFRMRARANITELWRYMRYNGLAKARDYLEHLPTYEDHDLDEDAWSEDLEDEDFADEDDDEDEATA